MKRNIILGLLLQLQLYKSKLQNYTISLLKTMKIAQELYEGIKIGDKTTGLITYMRTDSIRLSPVFINSCKEYINSSLVKTTLELLK